MMPAYRCGIYAAGRVVRRIMMTLAFVMSVAISSASSVAQTEDLTWEDLLPTGEIETLNRLYDEFYSDLEAQMLQQYANAKSLNDLTSPEGSDMGGGAALGAIEEGSALDQMPQLGTFNVVEDLDGLNVRLPGYVVPLNFRQDHKYREFLLVPYYGACLHTPPPPPNQIVYIRSKKPIRVEDIWMAYWVEGTMHTKRNLNEVGNTAYSLTLSKLTEFEY